MEVNKSQMEAGIRAYQLATQILSNLTTDNAQLKQEVSNAHGILFDVLTVLVDDYYTHFPATDAPVAEASSDKKKSRKKAGK